MTLNTDVVNVQGIGHSGLGPVPVSESLVFILAERTSRIAYVQTYWAVLINSGVGCSVVHQ